MTPTYRQPGTYYGQAQAQFYNGNGYQTYTAYRTPNIHSRLSNSPILLNDKGEKCGSALHHPDGLDLILAMGELGRVGYVRNRDLNPIPPNTPDEALSHSASTYDNVAIPIYDFQGEAVVDLFIVTQSIPCNCPACNLKQPSSHSNILAGDWSPRPAFLKEACSRAYIALEPSSTTSTVLDRPK